MPGQAAIEAHGRPGVLHGARGHCATHLGGDAAHVEARAAQRTAALHARHLHAQLRGLDGAHVASRAAADDHHVLHSGYWLWRAAAWCQVGLGRGWGSRTCSSVGAQKCRASNAGPACDCCSHLLPAAAPLRCRSCSAIVASICGTSQSKLGLAAVAHQRPTGKGRTRPRHAHCRGTLHLSDSSFEAWSRTAARWHLHASPDEAIAHGEACANAAPAFASFGTRAHARLRMQAPITGRTVHCRVPFVPARRPSPGAGNYEHRIVAAPP